MSGGQAGAEAGRLTVMCGADSEAVFERARGVIDAYAVKCERMGPAGAGQLTKMVNQICIAGVVQGLAEAVDFTLRAGLDPAQVFDVIGKGAAQSWQMDNRAATMAAGEFDFGFAVEWMRKDLGFCLAEAHRLGGRLPARRPRRPVLRPGRASAAASAGTPAASSSCSASPEPGSLSAPRKCPRAGTNVVSRSGRPTRRPSG